MNANTPSQRNKSYFDKVWNEHLIMPLGSSTDLLQIDRLVLHELSGSQVMHALDETGRAPMNRDQVFTVIEHLISTRPGRGPNDSFAQSGPIMIQTTRDASKKWGLNFFDYDNPRQGIAHVMVAEQGIAFPGATLVCCDSHTSTLGGIGALAWGIGASEAEHVLVTQALAQDRPRLMRVNFEGRLDAGVYAKDMVLALIGRIGAQGGIGFATEYAGSAVAQLPVEGRLTLCNMSIEFQCKYGFVPPDATTYEYLAGLPYSPKGAAWDAALLHWKSLSTDIDAVFDKEITIDCDGLAPQVTWGISPQHVGAIDHAVPDPDNMADPEARAFAMKALDYMRLTPGQQVLGTAIDAVYIGSCTNARLSDLRVAAEVLRGRKIAPGIQAVCVPGSTEVKRAAEAEGLDRVFLDAGFEWHESACGWCSSLGSDRFAGQRMVSTTNRNFEDRQGAKTRTHLASPATAAASAVAGCIADARRLY